MREKEIREINSKEMVKCWKVVCKKVEEIPLYIGVEGSKKGNDPWAEFMSQSFGTKLQSIG